MLPATALLCEQGLVESEHVRVIATTLERLARVPGLDPEAYADAEATLAESATQLAPAGLERVARRLVTLLDPDGAAPPEDGEMDELHLVRRRDGRVQGSFGFHSRAEADLLVEVFDRLSGPAGPDDPRTLAQRRAEVLADLAAQAVSPTGVAAPDHSNAAAGTDAGADTGDGAGNEAGPDESRRDATVRARRAPGCPSVPVLGRALLAVTMDLHWLTAQVGHGLLDADLPVDPATARRLACDAGIVPSVLGSRSEPSTSDGCPTPSPTACAAPCTPATAAAPSPAARVDHYAATPITSSIGSTTDRPSSTTSRCSAATTTS